ncbi:MAG: 50S ribosomal protein L5 [Candidatus Aenigmatarchaeota archaeon]
MSGNPMREVRLGKVTINIGAGESGPQLEKSKAILEKITGKTVVTTRTRKRTTFGMAKKRPIGVRVTLRGPEAIDIVKKLLQAVDNRLRPGQFDRQGSFSFGVAEYINIPGVKYDPDVGILGMDVCVTLERPGYRIKRRMVRPKKVGKRHRVTPEEAMEFARKVLGAAVTEAEE